MADLNTQSFAALKQQFAAAVQAQTSDLTDFTVGSILLAVAEADGGNTLWLQALIIQVLAVTRAQTSFNTDLDTFAVQFMPALPGTVSATLPNGTPRLQQTFATGQVTFGRNTVSSSAPFIANGSLVKTSDGTQQFTVYGDSTNSFFSPALLGYTMPANVGSISVPVQALTGGTAGNVAAGTITLVASELVGVDTVVNAAAFTNGVDQESDPALLARLQQFFPSLSKGTRAAITYWIAGVQAGMQNTIHECVDPNGATDYGSVTNYVDDGSGAPSMTLVQACMAALENTRPAGIRYQTLADTTILANYSMIITTAAGYVHNTVVGLVEAAVSAFIDALGIENTLPYTQLSAQAYAIAGVTNVSAVLLNGATADLVPAMGQTVKVGTSSVS